MEKIHGPCQVTMKQASLEIYTIKTQTFICVYVCMCINLFVSSELTEETGRFRNLIFGIQE